eukprot:COSAG04_NODE_79_length_28132_cov_136.219634_2_plen_187_part_00
MTSWLRRRTFQARSYRSVADRASPAARPFSSWCFRDPLPDGPTSLDCGGGGPDRRRAGRSVQGHVLPFMRTTTSGAGGGPLVKENDAASQERATLVQPEEIDLHSGHFATSVREGYASDAIARHKAMRPAKEENLGSLSVTGLALLVLVVLVPLVPAPNWYMYWALAALPCARVVNMQHSRHKCQT